MNKTDMGTNPPNCPCRACSYIMGKWLWEQHPVKYCPECGSHLSSIGEAYAMQYVDYGNEGDMFNTIPHLDNGSESHEIKVALRKMGCVGYWHWGKLLDDPGIMVPIGEPDWKEGHTMQDHETYLNFLRRVHRFAKEVAPQ